MPRPDDSDRLNAYRAGWRHGRDVGAVTPDEAAAILRDLPTTIPVAPATVAQFVHGAADGAAGHATAYLRSYAVAL